MNYDRIRQSTKSNALQKAQTEATSIEHHLKSPTLMMLVLIAVFGSLLYASFLLNPTNRGDTLPFILVVLAETFLIAQALLALWTVLASGYDPRNYGFHNAQEKLLSYNPRQDFEGIAMAKAKTIPALKLHGETVNIDIFITTFGEDIDIIRRTAIAAQVLLGRHATYILDDGKSDTVRELANELGVDYIRRNGNDGAKAGNINNALTRSDGEFFVIFDADFVPDKMFLFETIPFFENPKVAFVQTPQYYDNLDNMISRGAGYMQHLFYSLILPGKNRFNAAFCVGTNVIFRRSSINEIGGMYQLSKSEDIWTSLRLHRKGFQSVYIPNVLAVGKTPETIKAYSKQQLRWATGGFEILFQARPLTDKKLTIDQRLQYFGTATYYFSGLAALFLLLLPPLQIFFNLTPVNLRISAIEWAIYYSGFYVMQILVAFYTMGGFRFQTLLLANSSFPIYVKAFFNALFHRDQTWQATGSINKFDSAFNYIIPQALIFVFLLGTSMVGIWKANYTGDWSLSVFWNVVNTLVLGSFTFIAFQETYRIKRESRVDIRLKHIGETA